MKLAILFLTCLCSIPVAAKEKPAEAGVFGVWETERVPDEGEDKVAHIKIQPCKDNPKNVCGKLIWSEEENDPETGKPKLDKNNSDESLRSRPIMCIETLKDFEPGDAPNTYQNGKLYSSRTGKTYSGSIEMKDPDHLLLTGGVLWGLISRTTTWTRVKGEVKDPCK